MANLGKYVHRNNGIKEDFVPPVLDTHVVEEGDVFELPINLCPDFSNGDYKASRRYRAMQRYPYFMLCESMMGGSKHLRSIDYFTLQNATIVRR